VYAAYPLGDVLLVAALLWLVLSPGVRSAPTAFVMTALVGTAALDVAYSVVPRFAPSFDLAWFDGWYSVMYALLAAAVLHRNADELTDPAPDVEQRLHPARVVFLGAALFTAPTASIGRASGMSIGTRAFLLTASFAIGAIVLTRFTLAARERESARDSLAYRAAHDELTALVNRALFLDRLDHALAQRDGSNVAVLYFDLDRFKPINDTWGHRAGDAVLVEVARRVQCVVREGDTVARIGGDEFAVLCESISSPTDAIGVAQRIGEVVADPIELEVGIVSVGASIGIAFPNAHSATSEALVRDADAAMYRAKENGRDRYEVYDARMRTWLEERRTTETALQQAVRDGELRLVYQPVVHLSSGEVTAFEALLRWVRPGHGVVPPAEFIDIAEETGMIVPIGAWVLEEACNQLVAWNAANADRPPLGMAVNVSVRQFRHTSFVHTLQNVIETTGIDPDLLTLEVTESMLISDGDAAIAQLQSAKDLGVRIAIDDFGTGYSSLAYLRRFPFDVVKIDRTFTQDIGNGAADTTLVAGVVALAHVLGHAVVAEGAETVEQVMSLHALRCDFVQGYYFSTPLDAPHATELVDGDRNLAAQRAA
jgi:diguanylate cyclase (GGDEF)-like protein